MAGWLSSPNVQFCPPLPMTFSPTVHMFLYTITTPYFIMERHSFLFKGTSDKLQSACYSPSRNFKDPLCTSYKNKPCLTRQLVFKATFGGKGREAWEQCTYAYTQACSRVRLGSQCVKLTRHILPFCHRIESIPILSSRHNAT